MVNTSFIIKYFIRNKQIFFYFIYSIYTNTIGDGGGGGGSMYK